MDNDQALWAIKKVRYGNYDSPSGLFSPSNDG